MSQLGTSIPISSSQRRHSTNLRASGSRLAAFLRFFLLLGVSYCTRDKPLAGLVDNGRGASASEIILRRSMSPLPCSRISLEWRLYPLFVIRHGRLPFSGSKSTNGSNNFLSLGETNQVMVTDAECRKIIRFRGRITKYHISTTPSASQQCFPSTVIA